MAVTYMAFSAFRPDGTAYGRELDRLVNAIPWNGGARSLRQIQPVASQAADGPVTGGYVHIFQADNAEQVARPDADTSSGAWLPSANSDLFDKINEATASDAEYISAGGAPTNEIVKLRLSDLVTPSVATGHVVNWRYRLAGLGGGDAWEIKCRLMEGVTEIDEQVVTGTGNTAGVLQTQLAPATVTITDYTDLFLEFEATAAGTAQKARPISDAAVGGWSTHAGLGVNLFQQIDEASVSDADFIRGPVLAVGASATYRAKLGSTTDPVTSAGHILRYRYRATNAGVTVTVKLLQGASTTIATWTHTSVSTTLATATQTLTAAQANAITDYADLYFEVAESYPTSATSTVNQSAAADGEANRTLSSGPGARENWLDTTGDFGQDLSVASPGDSDTALARRESISSSIPNRIIDFEVTLAAVADPQVSNDHVLRFQAERIPAGSISIPWQLRQSDGSLIQSGTLAVTATTPTFYEVAITNADAITSYALLRLFIGQHSGLAVGENGFLHFAELRVPEPRRAEVTWVEFEVPSTSRVDITWAEVRAPAVDTAYHGDLPTIFAGTPGKLYGVASTGFTDLSAYAYGAGGIAPGGWRFASRGNHVIATNGVDPVQYRASNSGPFADMMTSTDKPKARFVAPVRDHLMLASITHASADSAWVWWSALDNIQDFDPDVATQCDRRHLYSTRGQIMGLVGGEYVRVWKRRAMHVGSWVGEDIVFRFDGLSNSVGTPYPSSIAEGVSDVMFWGGDCFYRQSGLEHPVSVGRGVVSGYLTDVEFSSGHIKPLEPASLDEEDQIMIGAFDPLAGVYVWIYQGSDDPLWRHSRAVVYNPTEDRWALFELPGDVSTLITQPNTSNAQTQILRGLLGFSFDGTDSSWFRFDGATVYEQTFRTKVFPIALDDNDRPLSIRIRGVLPLFSAVTNDGVLPSLTIRVESAYDPRFLNDFVDNTYTSANTDNRHVFPFDQTGYFWRVTVTVPEVTGKAINVLDGLYFEWEASGEA